MGSPQFVALETVLDLHDEGLRRFGGSPGIRDPGLIESALGAVQNAYYYVGADTFLLAATYAFHLAQAQAFLDGNKRVAVATALVFLAENGYAKKPDQDRLYDAMIAMNGGSISRVWRMFSAISSRTSGNFSLAARFCGKSPDGERFTVTAGCDYRRGFWGVGSG